jgi:hypothetical protein
VVLPDVNGTRVLGNSMYQLPSELLSADGRDRINNVEVGHAPLLAELTLWSACGVDE